MIDWQRNEELLINWTDAALRAFFSQHPTNEVCAIGYVFELWNASEQFDLCANTHAYFNKMVETSRAKWPELSNEDEIRWNSGDFEFPAGLPGESYRAAWASWSPISIRLHKFANEEEYSRAVYEGMIKICCAALAELAKRGLFGDWSKIHFNVSEVGDGIPVIKERDRQIRRLIDSG